MLENNFNAVPSEDNPSRIVDKIARTTAVKSYYELIKKGNTSSPGEVLQQIEAAFSDRDPQNMVTRMNDRYPLAHQTRPLPMARMFHHLNRRISRLQMLLTKQMIQQGLINSETEQPTVQQIVEDLPSHPSSGKSGLFTQIEETALKSVTKAEDPLRRQSIDSIQFRSRFNSECARLAQEKEDKKEEILNPEIIDYKIRDSLYEDLTQGIANHSPEALQNNVRLAIIDAWERKLFDQVSAPTVSYLSPVEPAELPKVTKKKEPSKINQSKKISKKEEPTQWAIPIAEGVEIIVDTSAQADLIGIIPFDQASQGVMGIAKTELLRVMSKKGKKVSDLVFDQKMVELEELATKNGLELVQVKRNKKVFVSFREITKKSSKVEIHIPQVAVVNEVDPIVSPNIVIPRFADAETILEAQKLSTEGGSLLEDFFNNPRAVEMMKFIRETYQSLDNPKIDQSKICGYLFEQIAYLYLRSQLTSREILIDPQTTKKVYKLCNKNKTLLPRDEFPFDQYLPGISVPDGLLLNEHQDYWSVGVCEYKLSQDEELINRQLGAYRQRNLVRDNLGNQGKDSDIYLGKELSSFFHRIRGRSVKVSPIPAIVYVSTKQNAYYPTVDRLVTVPISSLEFNYVTQAFIKDSFKESLEMRA